MKAVIFVIFIYYVCIAYIIKNPDVSESYAAYYISRTSELTPMEIERLAPISPPAHENHLSSRLGFDGWHKPEQTHIWAKRVNPKIFFRLERKNTRLLNGKIILDYIPIRGQSGKIYINGKQVGFLPENGSGHTEFEFDKNILMETNYISFELDKIAIASDVDPRSISLAFNSVILE